MKLKHLTQTFLFLLLVLLPVVALAQAAAASAVAPTDPFPDYTPLAVTIISLVGGFVVTIGTWGVKVVFPRVPAIAWPFVVLGLSQAAAFAQAYATHTFANPMVTAAVMAGAQLIYALASTAKEQGLDASTNVKKFAGLLLIGSLGLVGLQGCASTQKAKKEGTVALTAVHSALNLIEVTLLKTECGKAGAPIAPACVPADAADKAYVLIGKAGRIGNEASVTLRKLPPEISVEIGYSRIEPFLKEIWELVDQVRALFPSSNAASKLESDLASFKAKS